MGDDAQDYTANGPTDIGFRTGGDGTGIDNGVVAQGKITGVTGIGLAPPGSVPQPIGVVGKGQIGVVGLGRQPENTAPDSSVGVFGQGSVGVRGSTDGAHFIGVDGESTFGIGVKGFSNADDGIVGVSNGDRKSGVFGDHQQEKGAVFGVSGRTLSPDGAGINGFSDRGIGVRGDSVTNDGVVGSSRFKDKSGVFGRHTGEGEREAGFGVSGTSHSPEGAGVNGFSVGYGGHFSGDRAPLRLKPAAAPGHPTTGFHQKGEFYVDVKGNLFYCRDDGTPGTWFRVQLIPA
jgi:hypothetical protein